MIIIPGKYTTAKVMIDDVEETAMSQIVQFVNHPAFTNHIAIMPDTHAGKGSVVGFTMPMTEKVIPNVIGVDIGCGVVSINIGKNLRLSLSEIDHKIRQQVPFGFSIHEKPILNMKKDFPWKTVNDEAHKFVIAYHEKFGAGFEVSRYDMEWFVNKCSAIGCDLGRAIKGIGSLGGGNHFFEIGISDKGDYWVTVHTGSRNFGKCICDYWQNKAIKKDERKSKDDIQKAIKDIKTIYSGKELYDKIKALKAAPIVPATEYHCSNDLKWLEGEDVRGYLLDMLFSQIYAKENRWQILKIVMSIFDVVFDMESADYIETVHNFIDFKDFIVRKGSVRSYEDERFVLPFNMRDGILICTGKSNGEWNYSAPHGAGRVLSRGQAKKKLDVQAFKKQMEGIFSTSVGRGTLDESPMAYKDCMIIEETIRPTAEIIGRIKPVLNMKDSDTSDEIL